MGTFNTTNNGQTFSRGSGGTLYRNGFVLVDPRLQSTRGTHNVDDYANAVLLDVKRTELAYVQDAEHTDEDYMNANGTLTVDDSVKYHYEMDCETDAVSTDQLHFLLNAAFNVPPDASVNTTTNPNGLGFFRSDIIPELFTFWEYDGGVVKKGSAAIGALELDWNEERGTLAAKFKLTCINVTFDQTDIADPNDVHPVAWDDPKIRTPLVTLSPANQPDVNIAVPSIGLSFVQNLVAILPQGARRYNTNLDRVIELDDSIFAGVFAPTGTETGTRFQVKITNEGTTPVTDPDTIQWRQFIDIPGTDHKWTDWSADVDITPGSPIALANGMTIDFAADLGHTAGSLWDFGTDLQPELFHQCSDIQLADENWHANYKATVMEDSTGYFEKARANGTRFRPIQYIDDLEFYLGLCRVKGSKGNIHKAAAFELDMMAIERGNLGIDALLIKGLLPDAP